MDIEMELDSGADRSTIPWALFQEKLAGACELVHTDLTLYQYDKSPLMIKGQCKVTVQVLSENQHNLNCSGCKKPDSLIWQRLDGILWVGSSSNTKPHLAGQPCQV